jgi:hypothetical protein
MDLFMTKKIYALESWENAPYGSPCGYSRFWDYIPSRNELSQYFFNKQLLQCGKKKNKFITELEKGWAVYDKVFGYSIVELDMQTK